MIFTQINRKKWRTALPALAAAAGILTLLPFPGASDCCILGYKSICPFSPISTTLLFFTGSMIYGHLR